MRPVRRILVRIDNPSAPSLPAVTKAAQLARVLGAELTLFQNLANPFSPEDEVPARHLLRGSLQNYSRSAHEACLKGIALGLKRHGIQVSVAVHWGSPDNSALLKQAECLRSDLIVIDTLAPQADRTLGASDRQLAQRSPIPVLLVKRLAPYRRPKILLALDPERGSHAARLLDAQVMHLGASLCAALRGSLHAVTAYTTRSRLPGDDGPLSAAVLTTTPAPGAPPGGAIPGIVRHFASDIRSALVVMGASADGSHDAGLVTAEQPLIERLACDILMVKPPVHDSQHAAKQAATAQPAARASRNLDRGAGKDCPAPP